MNCCSGAFAETKKGSFYYCRVLHFVVQEREYIRVRGFHLVGGGVGASLVPHTVIRGVYWRHSVSLA